MWKSRDDYLGRDELNRPYNKEFPPEDMNNPKFDEGYEKWSHYVTFWELGLGNNSIRIKHQGVWFYINPVDGDCICCLDNGKFIPVDGKVYATPNDLIKEFRFSDGKGLLDLIDDIDDDDIMWC